MATVLPSRSLRFAQSFPFVFRSTGVRGAAFFLFPINPESFALATPSRGGIVQTINGKFENFFGAGLQHGSLRGTFGFGVRPQIGAFGAPLSGQLHYKYLETMHAAFYNEAQITVRNNAAKWIFLDITDLHFFQIRLRTFNCERATTHQFLHRYTIEFDVIDDYLNPTKPLRLGDLIDDLVSIDNTATNLDQAIGDFGALPDASQSAIFEKASVIHEETIGPEDTVF
jgi:hypothetical protein